MNFKIITKFITNGTIFRFIKKVPRQLNGFHLNANFSIISNKFIANSRFLDSLLDIILYGIIKGYYKYIELRGTGYKFRLISSNKIFGIILRIGYCHLIHIKIPTSFRLYYYNRLTLCLYNNNLGQLNNKVQVIKIKKKSNIYKGKGIFFKNSVLKLKKSTKLRF